jgi:xylulokinase
MRIDHRREHLLRAALEGVAFGIRVAFEALPAVSETTALRLAGGGTEHPVWRQMLADILNRELLTVDTPAASARGAALLAGIASGVWTNADATASMALRISHDALPSAERVSVYNKVYRKYLGSIN